jgi:D-alanyl-D-alanine carboxypeptidase
MRSRRTVLVLYVVLPLLLIVVGVGAYSLSAYRKRKEQREMEERRLLTAFEVLLAQGRDLLARHPDFDLQAEKQFLDSLAQAPRKERLQRRGQIEELVSGLRSRLLFMSTGTRPGDPQWDLVCLYNSYTANGFKELADTLSWPNTQAVETPPPITGAPAADARIVALARTRGYRLRPQVADQALAAWDRHLLQPGALAAWQSLQAAARQDGIRLELVSAYRSISRQRQIFLSELRSVSLQEAGREYTPAEIASGAADRAIDAVLRYSSIPGFSRHHSGCAIDVSDPSQGQAFTEFENTRGFAWLSALNYLNAKRFGFIPSYPQGAESQGPEPEPWEYLWVGEEHLRASAGACR